MRRYQWDIITYCRELSPGDEDWVRQIVYLRILMTVTFTPAEN